MKRILQLSLTLMLFLVYEGFAQERTLAGTVTSSEDGGPLPGVTVTAKGNTSIGTVTDGDGKFNLSVPGNVTALVFSYIGMTTQEVAIDTRTTINVSLVADTKQLTEVVVTAQGIEKSQKSLGYAATNVKSIDVVQGRAFNPMAGLQGKVAGVNISTASGAPGASTKVVIRGYSSIGGNNNPLYVVDGVPINNTPNNFSTTLSYDPLTDVDRTLDFGNRANDINPDDIESMSILKGAAATNLYGSRAANGVIMITTKKGKLNEKPKVDFTSSLTFSNPLRLPQLQNKFGQGWSGHFAFEENGSWGPLLDGQDRLWGNVVDGQQQLKPFKAQKDNLKDFYTTGKSFINTVGLSGGTDKATYYLSYSNVTEDGILPSNADSYDRNTISLRGSLQGNRLSSNATLNFVRKDAKVVATGQGAAGATVFQEIIQTPRDISLIDLKDYNNKFNNLNNFYNLYAQNPWYALYENQNEYDENRFYGNISLNYKFTDWLNATYRIGGDVAGSQLLDWTAIAKTDPNSPNATQQQFVGRVDERRRTTTELYQDYILSANKNISDDINLNGLLGYNVQDRYNKDLLTYINDLSIPNYYNLSNSALPPASATAESRRRLYGVYGSVTAGYKELLFLTVNARNDWSSTLPKGKNSFFYPGANLSFVFTDAFPDLKNIVSFGKVRASIGQTGNDADPYYVLNTKVPGNVQMSIGEIDFPLEGVNAFEVSNTLGNQNLKPEITTEVEFGANLQFFNNRLGIDAAYYDAKTKNQIYPVPVATSSGYGYKILNFGEVQNRGVELLLNVTPIRTNDFDWTISWNYSNNRNKVLSLNEGLERITLTSAYGIDFVALKGQPLGVFEGPQALRDAQGRIVVNTSGIPITAPDKKIYGNAQADYIMGINNTLKYKNLSFSFGFDIRQGGLLYSYSKQLSYFVGNASETLYNNRQPFIVPNSVYQPVDPDTGDPMVDDTGNPVYNENIYPVDMSGVSDYWNQNNNDNLTGDLLIKRSYVKLREVVIGYTFPNKLFKSTISNLNVSLVGRNLLLWTPEGNNFVDPEITTFGNDLTGDFGEFAAGPTVRSMGVSLRATF